MAAGARVLELVGRSDYELLAARVAHFGARLEASIREGGLFGVVPTVGTLSGLYLSREEVGAPTNFAEARVLADNGLYAPFFHAMLARGVALAPGAYEILFVGLAHDEDALEAAVAAAGEAAAEVASKS
jgi:glutamate-1-semialdehyde 2,1-aminomutase